MQAYAVRGRVLLILAVATPLFSIAALVAQLIPGGVESCGGSTTGASSCQALPAITAWEGPIPFVIAALLIALSFAPIVSLRTGAVWPVAVSAGLQFIPQVISFGGFIDWAPALLVTIVFVAVFATSPRR
jgi:hypothetical protein